MPGKRLDESKRECVRKLHEYFQKELANGGPLLPLNAIQEMKAILLLLCLSSIHLITAKSELCYDNKEECHSTNYQSYVECIRKRQKRSIDCDSGCESNNCIDTCNECDCNSCNYNSCNNSCNSCCGSCCSNFVPCHSNHCCHKTCHAQCSTSSCRSNCRKNCFDTVREKSQDKVIVEQGAGQISYPQSNTSINNINRHNITTIIHLNNIINNTNLVDIPIVLNNTNTQNITLFNEDHGESASTTERCCTVISPRQCVSTPTPRCFHYRSKQCGPFCTASIVHKEQQDVCSANYPGAAPTCSRQIIYIPQPQPKCTYQSVWPYVSCGVAKKETCQGCYSHYTNSGSNNYLSCPSQCYDDGFGGMGPMYRQGPVYRPWYSHVPCYQCLGYNNPYQNTDYGMGYPGVAGYPLYYPPGASPYFPQGNDSGNIPVLNVAGQLNPETDQMGDVVIEPGQINQSEYEDQFYDGRLPREVEIEVNYEPSSNAQAEVKIKGDDVPDEVKKIEGDTKTESTLS